MLDLRWSKKTACSGALAGTEEVHQSNKDTTYKGVTLQTCHPHKSSIAPYNSACRSSEDCIVQRLK